MRFSPRSGSVDSTHCGDIPDFQSGIANLCSSREHCTLRSQAGPLDTMKEVWVAALAINLVLGLCFLCCLRLFNCCIRYAGALKGTCPVSHFL